MCVCCVKFCKHILTSQFRTVEKFVWVVANMTADHRWRGVAAPTLNLELMKPRLGFGKRK